MRSLAGAGEGGAAGGLAPGDLLDRSQAAADDRQPLDGEALIGEPIHRTLGLRVGRTGCDRPV
jgi:hypothetical protein